MERPLSRITCSAELEAGLQSASYHSVKADFEITSEGKTDSTSPYTFPSNTKIYNGYSFVVQTVLAPKTSWSGKVKYSSVFEGVTKTSDLKALTTGALPTCGCEQDSDGAALNFDVVQIATESSVYFKFVWTDGSLCEAKYVFSRSTSSGDTSIGEYDSLNALDTSRANCGLFYDPETPSTTDPITDDAPGSERTYCIEPLGYGYTGDRVCKTATVMWFTKLSGSVTTPGGRGVKGVSFRWYFKDTPSISGTWSGSGADGSFDIAVTHPSYSEDTTALMLCPEKVSTGIMHEFEFNAKEVECAELTVHHLGVKNVAFTDTSEFLVTGHIKFPASEYIAANCGSENVEVCATSAPSDSAPSAQPVCAPTDGEGYYELSLAHGSSVYIRPTLNNHTFESVSSGDEEIYIDSVESAIDLQDFVDKTVVNIKTTLSGGSCGNYVGEYNFRIAAVNGCYTREVWERGSLTRDSFVVAPALDFDVTLLQVDAVTGLSGEEIRDYMDRENVLTQRLLLHEKTLQVGKVPWRYDPLPLITAVTTAATRGSCTDIEVVTSWRKYNVTFDFHQDFKTGGICRDVAGIVALQDNTRDGNECAGYCYPEMEHEVQIMDDKNVTTRSFVTYTLVPGAANVDDSGDYPFQRTLQTQFSFAETSTPIETIIPFFIEGEKLLGSEFSMDFPQSLPILILHDPPGGGSSAFFSEGVSISTQIGMSTGIGGGVAAKGTIKGGYEQKESVCLGVGVTKCSDVLTTTASGYATIAGSTNIGSSSSDGWSFGISNSNSYSTTGYDGLTGRDADTVLTTAINVKFGMSKEIIFNETSCGGWSRDSVQWMPNSPDSGEVIVYKTIFDIEQVMMPSLERSLEAEKAAEEPDSTTIFNLEAALEGWQDVVDYNDEIHANASLAAAALVDSPSGLDGNEASPNGARRISWSGGGQAYSFSSSSSSSESRSFSRKVAVSASLEAGFEIGMGLLGFTASVSGSLTASFNYDISSSDSTSTSSSIQTGFTLSDPNLGDYFVTEVLTDPVYGTPLFRTLSGLSRCIWEPGTVKREQIDITFPGGGRHVEFINLPPDESKAVTLRMCNHAPDEGTYDYKLNLVHSSNPNSLEISSLGVAIVEPRDYILPAGCTNIDVKINRGPIAFEYEEVKLRMVVPCESGFWNGNGMARMFDHVDISFTMKYIQPCPRVVFSGQTAADEAFVMNAVSATPNVVMLVVKNSEYLDTPWSESPRLENIILQYRKLAPDGEVNKKEPWISGDIVFKLSDGSVVDYDEHDEFGYLRIYWDVATIADGKWEVMVSTKCVESGPDTYEFDSSSSMVLPGVIDRQSPYVLSGFDEPGDAEWEIGDDISVITVENIDWDRGYEISGKTLDGEVVLTSNLLDTLAVGRLLLVAFGVRVDIGDLMDRTVQLQIDKYYDRAGNRNIGPYTWEFNVKKLDSVDVESVVSGIILSEGGTECVLARNSAACKGFDVLLRSEVSTLIQVGSSRITDATYKSVEVQPANSTAFTAVEVSFTITAAKGQQRAAWSLSASFVDLLEDKELIDDYDVLKNVYFKEPPKVGGGEWKNANGGISAKFFKVDFSKTDEPQNYMGSGLSKKNLFVAGASICFVLSAVAGMYVSYTRTVHKHHKRQHEKEELEIELEIEAEHTGHFENVDIDHMSPSEIRKMTAVHKMRRESGNIHGHEGEHGYGHHDHGGHNDHVNRPTIDDVGGFDNPMYSAEVVRKMTAKSRGKSSAHPGVSFGGEFGEFNIDKVDDLGVEQTGRKKSMFKSLLVSAGLSRPPGPMAGQSEQVDEHHSKELQMKNLAKFGSKHGISHDLHKQHSHATMQMKARARKSHHTHEHLKQAPLPPGRLPAGVDQYFTDEGTPYYYHEESGKVFWNISDVEGLSKHDDDGDTSGHERVRNDERELPHGVKAYLTEDGVEYYYCVKSGRTVWSLEDIEAGVDA
jgi:hypothetical protein